jgi:hypothetical protein
MSDSQFATMLFAMPFLALCAGGLIAQVFAIRAQVRVVAKRRQPRR